MFCMLKKKKYILKKYIQIIYPYVSKHNSNCEKQLIHLMILNKEKIWHQIAVKKLSASLRRVT